MQITHVLGDHLVLGIVPRAPTNAVAGIDCACTLSADVGVPVELPRPTAEASRVQIASAPARPPRLPPLPEPALVDKKTHGILDWGLLRRGRLCERQSRNPMLLSLSLRQQQIECFSFVSPPHRWI